MDEAEKKQFEKRINSYLKEIDKCIAALGTWRGYLPDQLNEAPPKPYHALVYRMGLSL